MSNHLAALTTISRAILALFTASGAAGCDDPDDALARALDAADAPALQEAPAPKGFAIKKVTTGGKGCPDPASVAIELFADKTLRLVYKDMLLESPPGAALQTTNCQAALLLQVPAGWKVALSSLKTHIRADLAKDIKARHHASAFFAGVPGGVEFEKEFVGPYDDNDYAVDVVAPASTIWSSCGGSAIFSINSSLLLNASANPNGHATIRTVAQRLVAWKFKPC